MPTPPLIIPKEKFDQALNLAAEGKPVRTIIASMGCSRTQFYKILQNNPDFEREYSRARKFGFETVAEDVLTLVDDDPFGDPQLLKIKADNMKWFLGVCDPARYGQRQTLTVESVDIGAALTEAKNRARLIDITPRSPQLEQPVPDPFE